MNTESCKARAYVPGSMKSSRADIKHAELKARGVMLPVRLQ